MLDRPLLRHRGFELTIRQLPSAGTFAFVVSHLGLALHTSAAEFRSALSADRAARRFVDDALRVFDDSTAAFA